MNTMTNAMTWDAIAANEGSEIEAMTSTETSEVSGGDLFTAAVAAAAGYAATHSLPALNRIVVAFGAGVAAY